MICKNVERVVALEKHVGQVSGLTPDFFPGGQVSEVPFRPLCGTGPCWGFAGICVRIPTFRPEE